MRFVEMDAPTLCPRCQRELKVGELMAVYGKGRISEIMRRCSPCDKDVARGVHLIRQAKEQALWTDPPEQAEQLSKLSFGDSMAQMAESLPSFRRAVGPQGRG